MRGFSTVAAPRGSSHEDDIIQEARGEILGWITLPNYPDKYTNLKHNAVNPPFLGILLDVDQFRLRTQAWLEIFFEPAKFNNEFNLEIYHALCWQGQTTK